MSDIDADTDFASMKVAELKKALKSRGLSVTGVKQELIDRLQLSVGTEDTDPNNDTDLLDDANELLGVDDDDVVTLEAPKVTKVALKPITAPPSTMPTTDKTATTPVEKPKEEDETKNLETDNGEVKPKGGLTDSERVAARASRFGAITAPSDVKKAAGRAERFGVKDASNKIGDSPTVDLDTLKKRAERFGQSSSTAIKKAEMDEKIRKRQERFGMVQPEAKKAKKSEVLATVEINKTIVSPPKEVDEKLVKRAERFGAKPVEAAT